MAGRSSILFENEAKTVVLLDLPRSIEEGQVPSAELRRAPRPTPTRRLLSAPPPNRPFPTPEPKDGESLPGGSPAGQLTEMMTLAAVQSALDELEKEYSGPWCLPRILKDDTIAITDASTTSSESKNSPSPAADFFVPVGSEYLVGTIQELRGDFIARAPQFDFILLDPPWPNRSARRKKKNGYALASGLDSIRELLSLIPVASKLAAGGVVGVWVTNNHAFAELLTGPRGVFYEWGVELVATWTWLKVTTAGEPIFNSHSQWRKPWERLLLARRVGSQRLPRCGDKVVVAVPDAHSRKPSLRRLLEEHGILPVGFPGLEVFARNLTAGWWSWGDEALLFQHRDYWAELDVECNAEKAE